MVTTHPRAQKWPPDAKDSDPYRVVDILVNIHWSYGGKSGVAKHKTFASVHAPGEHFSLGEYWWTDGNMGCDCNRVHAIGLKPQDFPELFWPAGELDGHGTYDHVSDGASARCGDRICISRIESLDPLIPDLVLDEKPAD